MIASINGRVVEIEEDSLIVEVGGVGLRVFAPAPLIAETQTGKSIALKTHLIVRETELTLYGFQTGEECHFFNLLISVSGIGPRTALAALSTLNPNAIRRAVFNEQPEVFTRVPGIGKKTAQSIQLHLQDKIKAVDGLEPVAGMDDFDTEVLAALTALGYSVVEAQAALQFIPKDTPQDVEERLRIALGYFSKPG